MNTENNKSKELFTKIELKNDKLLFEGTTSNQPAISIDYFPPFGDGLGYTSLELFLLSLSSCLASSVALLLRKMNKNLTGLKVESHALRSEIHPTILYSINLNLIIQSTNADILSVNKAIELSENQLCPVLNMLSEKVKVIVSHEIIK